MGKETAGDVENYFEQKNFLVEIRKMILLNVAITSSNRKYCDYDTFPSVLALKNGIFYCVNIEFSDLSSD